MSEDTPERIPEGPRKIRIVGRPFLKAVFKTDEQAKSFFCRQKIGHFKRHIDEMHARERELESIIIPGNGEASTFIYNLLKEARDLYVDGYFYGCIAICCVISERVMKDLARDSIRIADSQGIRSPSDEALEKLERVDFRTLWEFLLKCGIISKEISKVTQKLAEMRNDYLHGNGANTQIDAKEAITNLTKILRGTVANFNNYDFREGHFRSYQGPKK